MLMFTYMCGKVEAELRNIILTEVKSYKEDNYRSKMTYESVNKIFKSVDSLTGHFNELFNRFS
jgi:hypothetical protein